MLKINELLGYLYTCKPYRPSTNKNSTQRIADFASKWFLRVSLAAFFVLCVVALVNKFWFRPPDIVLETALVCYIVSMILIVLSMLSVIISEIASFWERKQRGRLGKTKLSATIELTDAEIETDESHVEKLAAYDGPLLTYAQRYLQLKVTRMDRRISFFFGEKVALVSLFIFASTQLKAAGGMTAVTGAFEHWSAPAHYLDTFLLATLALGAGIVLGSLLLKVRQRSYLYQLDLIEMALLRQALVKEIRGKSAEARHARNAGRE
ncbi:hypothetical protein P3T24_006581 [Paraburkholderia sp. GAS33]|uniref:hypothetical protein n=1 Tax=Paraburkholderia sp. GAS33 TaxID=3035130 RepID=UPI003D1A3FD1